MKKDCIFEEKKEESYTLEVTEQKILRVPIDFRYNSAWFGLVLPSNTKSGYGNWFLNSKDGLIPAYNVTGCKFNGVFCDNRYNYEYLIYKTSVVSCSKTENEECPVDIPQLDNNSISAVSAVSVHTYGHIGLYDVTTLYNNINNFYIPPSIDTNDTNDTETDKMYYFIIRLFKEYIDFKDEEQYNLLPVWIIGTYLYPIFQCYPYISLFGRKATGKSKVLYLTSKIAFNAETTVNGSSASIFFMSHEQGSTLLIDENEIFKKQKNGTYNPRSQEIIPLFLTGYKKGSYVTKIRYTATEGRRILEKFNSYCPKMFASTEWDEEVFGSRTIPVIMRPATKEIGGMEIPEDEEYWKNVRTLILDWVLKNYEKVQEEYKLLENNTGLQNREYEIIKPLIAISNVLYPSHTEKFISYLKEVMTERVEDELDSFDFRILNIISDLKEDKYYSFEDITELCMTEENLPVWFNPKWFGKFLKKSGITFQKKRLAKCREYRFFGVKALLERFGGKK